MKLTTSAFVTWLLVVSCGGIVGDDAGATTTSTSNASVSSTTMADLPYVPRPDPARPDPALVPDWFVDEGPLPETLDALARELIAETSGTEAEELTLAGAMFVTWNDSSLGCPQPGQVYLQVLTDGYLAYYESGQSSYRVHTDLASNVVVCDLPAVPNPLARS